MGSEMCIRDSVRPICVSECRLCHPAWVGLVLVCLLWIDSAGEDAPYRVLTGKTPGGNRPPPGDSLFPRHMCKIPVLPSSKRELTAAVAPPVRHSDVVMRFRSPACHAVE